MSVRKFIKFSWDNRIGNQTSQLFPFTLLIPFIVLTVNLVEGKKKDSVWVFQLELILRNNHREWLRGKENLRRTRSRRQEFHTGRLEVLVVVEPLTIFVFKNPGWVLYDLGHETSVPGRQTQKWSHTLQHYRKLKKVIEMINFHRSYGEIGVIVSLEWEGLHKTFASQ